ncbi:MAG: alpha-amylase family glycosyl hydrolase [Spirochaetia bacterium]
MNHWATESVFYHIYPLGLCGAPRENDFHSEPVNRLERVKEMIPYLEEMGINAVYIGPHFESKQHGYDTVDYFKVDRRLGTNQLLREVVEYLHNAGIHVIFDAVFNHVGRDFGLFQDVKQNREASQYKHWFKGLDFSGSNPCNDGFDYETWDGHYELVKLDLTQQDVRNYILSVADQWIREFDIDGLRLDAADVMDKSFLAQLTDFTKAKKEDFWMVGEVVHGDYSQWIQHGKLDSVTNYECYKGLYSSHNDKNFHEIAYSLKRQFGEGGIYQDFPLYNFVDNHDVDRVASTLTEEHSLYTLYGLLFTIPGVPSIYYGSEWGIQGKRDNWGDSQLRPSIDPEQLRKAADNSDLFNEIKRLIELRLKTLPLLIGSYREILVEQTAIVFERKWDNETVIVAVNAGGEKTSLAADQKYSQRFDILNNEDLGAGSEIEVYPHWLRILKVS